MKYSIPAQLFIFACGISHLTAQGNSNGSSTAPNAPPSHSTRTGYCKSCEDGTLRQANSATDCTAGETFVAYNTSVDCKFGAGTTTYPTRKSFVDQDLGDRQPAFTGYNAPSLDAPPFAASLASEWGNQMLRPVIIGLVAEEITDATFTPAALQLYGGSAGNAWVKKDASGALRQILSDQYLTDITTADGAVVVNSYFRSTIGAIDGTTGLYTIPGSAKFLRAIRISRPDSTDLTTLNILVKDYSSSQTSPKIRGHRWVKSGTGASVTWTFSQHSDEPNATNLITSDVLEKTDLGGGLIQRTRTRRQIAGGTTVITSITRDKYRDLGGGMLRIFETVEALGAPEQITTAYTYTDATGKGVTGLDGVINNPTAGAPVNNIIGGRLHSLQRSDGYWEEYAYQYNAGTRMMLTEKWSSWKDSAVGDKSNSRHVSIVLEDNARTVIEKIAGQTVASVHETLVTLPDGSRVLRTEAGLNAQEKSVTEHAYFADNAPAPNNGRIQYTRHPDGTLTRYTYSTVSDPTLSGVSALKTVTENGTNTDLALSLTTPDVDAGPVPALSRGTRTETLTNTFNKIISSKTYDIAINQVVDQSAAVTVDDVGRPTKVLFDGDPDDYTETTFACCGVKTLRGRDGSLTDFTKDFLERPTFTTVTLGSRVTRTGYEYTTETAAGYGSPLPRTVVTQSVTGSAATNSILISESVVNYRGQTIIRRSPDADGDGNPEITSTIESINASGRSIVTVDPLGNASTSTYFADGQPKSTATPGRAITAYDYTPHSLNGGGIQSTSTTGATVIKAFADLGGRTFRTETPGYNDTTLVATATHDHAGRVTGTTTTGKPSTSTACDVLGECREVWTDANGDGNFNNSLVDGIKDTYQRYESVIVNETVPMLRTRTWVRNDSNEDILLTTTYKSPDGRYTKTVPLTGPVTVTNATKPNNGTRSSTTQTFLTATQCLTQITTASLNADGTSTTVSVTKDTANTTLGTVTQIADLLDRTISQGDGRTPATTFGNFTASGQPRTITDGGGRVTTRIYDKLGRVTTLDLPDTTDSSDNTLSNITHTGYHPSGEVAAQWGDQTTATYQKFDDRGRRIALKTFRSLAHNIEPADNTAAPDTTTWTYEASTGLLTRKEYADGKGTDYTYTPDGKLRTRTWARSVSATYDLTPLGQLTHINYSDTTPDVSMTSDRLGRQTNISNGIAQSQFNYVGLALDTETISYDLDGQPGFEFFRVIDRSQDSLGRDQGWQIKNGDTVENQATYVYSTTTGRLSSVTGGGDITAPKSFAYLYTLNSNLINSVTGPVHTVTNTWADDRDVLLTKANTRISDTSGVSSITYTANSIGQRTNATRTGETTASSVWGYDNMGQLTSADSSVNDQDRGYLYDSIGNRRGVRTGAVGVPVDESGAIIPNVGTAAYGTNHLNQYTVIPQAPADPEYDFDGNMTSGPLPVSPTVTSNLIWNGENRLVEVKNGNTIISSSSYDALSRRIRKTVGNDTTLYLYDGFNCIAEYKANGISKTRLWGTDLSGSMQGAGGVGGLLAETHHDQTNPGTYYPCYDGNGNVTEYLKITTQDNPVTTDVNEEVVSVIAHFEYDPFGNTTVNTDTNNLFNYRFSTKPLDFETGLYYYTYRYMDPLTGRWPSRDPIEERGGENLYGLINNGPVNGVDVLGLDSPSSTRCQKLRASIEAKVAILKGKYRELANNNGNLPQSALGDDLNPSLSINGHLAQIAAIEAKLAADIAVYAATCNDPEPKCDPEPEPVPYPGTAKKVAVGAATLGVGYLIYRGVRMIPSVAAPPLWPTIPLNLAIP